MSGNPSPVRILDVGCGDLKAAGAVGIDCRALDGVDVVHDLDQTPWPLPDSAFDLIICSHVIEHVADIPRFLREVHRLGAAGARVRIATPHFSSLDSWTDPSHRHHLSLRSFAFFTEEGYLHQGRVFRIDRIELTFRRSALGSRIGAFLYRRSRYSYERNLAFLFPAMNIEAELVVVK
jgi:SAM-dependent methyltransferase